MGSEEHAPDRTVLVTGATGYVGGWVVARLLARGYRVRATVRDLGRGERLTGSIAEHAPVDALTLVAADLLKEDGWGAAFDGVDDLVHVASPVANDTTQDIVDTARTGVRHVFTAAEKAGVERIVMTSSLAAATTGHGDRVVDGETWANPSDSVGDTYARSKTLSERDAWRREAAGRWSLATILPGLVMGPAVEADAVGSSAELVRLMLLGKMPALPNLGGLIVDVRDIADLHVDALAEPGAAGQRLIAGGDFLWLRDIALLLRERLGDEASKVRTRRMPDALVRLAGRFNPAMAFMAASIGRRPRVDASRVEELLGWRTRAVEETLLDTARAILAAR
ncbi:NAD-dependent epimerase/dehydratase family protein [Streptomyces sp. NPDC050560]|uniref:NAD-dependent epimerase/dehydratase family protein n=1 Tax=Streptomyces sp. NPDC050560 TaxID=3365630 RepID=UPI00378E0381